MDRQVPKKQCFRGSIAQGIIETLRTKDIIDAQTNPTIAPYAKDGEAILRITAKARDEEEANRLIDPVAAVLKERLGDAGYGEGETDLETVVAEQLLQKQLTLAVAESCTGGMIASNLVEYPGISAALVEGCVTYSNEAKMHRLGVKAETLEKYGAVSEETAKLINETRAAGHRVIAVGTTSCRTLESVWAKYGKIVPCSGNTSIFIYPGVELKAIDGLITNFHLPESTLIMLIAAFYGYDKTMAAYKVAVEEKYRFFSFGDAMFIR